MIYYYVRYNVYPKETPPVEHEQWLAFADSHNDKTIKDHLSKEHDAGVTIISSAAIDEEQYAKKEKAR